MKKAGFAFRDFRVIWWIGCRRQRFDPRNYTGEKLEAGDVGTVVPRL
jgi:hypothetical protein